MSLLQQNDINELKAELNELNKLKQQEAIELADIEYDIYQMETNFLSKSNPLRSLIIKGKSLTNDSDNPMTNYHENDESNRIILNSSLTSQAVLNAKQLKKGLTTSQSLVIKQERSVVKSELVPVSMSLDCLKEEEESPYELRKERGASKRKL